MNSLIPIFVGALGAAAGFFLPELSEAICRYKFRRKDKTLSPDRRFFSLTVRLLCALLNAAGWVLCALRAQSLSSALLIGLIWYLSLLLGLIDVRVRLIPNALLLVILAAGGTLRVLLSGWTGLVSSLFYMLVLMVVFLSVAKFVGGLWCVGAGDVKLAGVLGLVLGYPAVVLGVIFMAVSMGSFCAVGLLTKKLAKTSMIPMAPFLSLGLMAGLAAVLLA